MRVVVVPENRMPAVVGAQAQSQGRLREVKGKVQVVDRAAVQVNGHANQDRVRVETEGKMRRMRERQKGWKRKKKKEEEVRGVRNRKRKKRRKTEKETNGKIK